MKVMILLMLILSGMLQAAEGPVHNSKIVIIHDYDHGNENMLDLEIDIMKSIKKRDSSYDCLFLEVDKSVNSSIERFLNGASYEETIAPWIENSEKTVGSKSENLIPGWYLTAASALNLKIFGADVEWSSEIGQKIIPGIALLKRSNDIEIMRQQIPLVVEARSRIIAENVMESLKSKTCNNAFVVIGNGHTESFPLDVKATPIQDFFKQEGFPVFRGN